MISVKNNQRKIDIDQKKLVRDAQIVLNALRYSDYDLGILLTTNKTIRTLNRTYRHKDKPTDILSFPFHPTLKAGKRIKPTSDDEKNLGDLIISLEYVQKAAQELGTTFEKRMRTLLVHGICHLLGYDHITDTEYAQMHRKELALLKLLNGQKR